MSALSSSGNSSRVTPGRTSPLEQAERTPELEVAVGERALDALLLHDEIEGRDGALPRSCRARPRGRPAEHAQRVAPGVVRADRVDAEGRAEAPVSSIASPRISSGAATSSANASAACRRPSSSSVITIVRVPAARNTCAARMPIAPAPNTTATSVRLSGTRRSAWTQVASGSQTTATLASRSLERGCAHASGTATSSAKPPGRLPPTSPRRAQMFSRPERQARQLPQAICGFTATRVPTRASPRPACGDDLAAELVAHDERRRPPRLRDATPCRSAADAGRLDPHQHLLRSRPRGVDALHLELERRRVEQRLHRPLVRCQPAIGCVAPSIRSPTDRQRRRSSGRPAGRNGRKHAIRPSSQGRRCWSSSGARASPIASVRSPSSAREGRPWSSVAVPAPTASSPACASPASAPARSARPSDCALSDVVPASASRAG